MRNGSSVKTFCMYDCGHVTTDMGRVRRRSSYGWTIVYQEASDPG
jgi:hypothetical protein